jgi:tRNA (cytidine56-2'-O)-methyltransferase
MITVLRIGHRISRDKRITTHCALVARAFGANSILVDTKDENIEKNIRSTITRFGGDFEIETGVDKYKIIKNWPGSKIHLTMYGDSLENSIKKINVSEDLLIIIGAEKVPPKIYELADFNVSVGNQPHSEVAALAILLDRLTKGKWLNKNFNGKLQIQPSNKGKKVISYKKNGVI